jgi:catecholate siderophore receptor
MIPNAANAGSLRASIPAPPFASGRSTLFGSPIYNGTHADVQTGDGVYRARLRQRLVGEERHDLCELSARLSQRLSGQRCTRRRGQPDADRRESRGLQNATNRNNVFNQTDFTYKAVTGPVKHTLMFGTEFGLPGKPRAAQHRLFSRTSVANTVVVNPFAPTYFGPVIFKHTVTPAQTDASSRTDLSLQSGYVQDQIEITRYLQVIAGVRHDRFDLTALDQNTNSTRGRVDDLTSPRGAVIVKPIDNLSIYGSYSISYLPASGDQFSTLNDGTLILEPQKFENKEVGVKWNILPKLLFTAAAYELDRTNVPIADPNRPGFFFPSGAHKIQGFEASLKGYVTDDLAGLARLRLHRRPHRQRDLADDRSRQRRAACSATPVRLLEQVSVHPDLVGGAWRHLLLGFVRLVGRHCQAAGLRALRCRHLRAGSTRPGECSSTSRTSSTGSTGPPPTATTTFRPVRGAPSG